VAIYRVTVSCIDQNDLSFKRCLERMYDLNETM